MKLDKNISYQYDATERRKVGKVDKRLIPYELSSRIAYDLWLVLVEERIPHGDNLVKQLRFRMKNMYSSDEVCLEAMEKLIEAGYLQIEKKKVSFCPYGFHRNSMEEFEEDVLKNYNYTHILSEDHARVSKEARANFKKLRIEKERERRAQWEGRPLSIDGTPQYIQDRPLTEEELTIHRLMGTNPNEVPYYQPAWMVLDGAIAPEPYPNAKAIWIYDPKKHQIVWALLDKEKETVSHMTTKAPDDILKQIDTDTHVLDEDGNLISKRHIADRLKSIKAIQSKHHMTPQWAKYWFDLAHKAGVPCDSATNKAPFQPQPKNQKPQLIDIASIHA